jgi:hypothetical protein
LALHFHDLIPQRKNISAYDFFVLGQALREDADSLREELEEKRAAYIKVATLNSYRSPNVPHGSLLVV